MNDKRLFIVANRLPVYVSNEQGDLKVEPSSGGLVSAIKSFLAEGQKDFSEVYWSGVPGCSPSVWANAAEHLQNDDFNYLPVPIYKEQYEQYYNGFSNSVLWPLFHYFPSFAEYRDEEYDSYQLVNEHFAEVLMRFCRPGDTIWIHDYHLLPLAAQIRKHLPHCTIGFFLHIPFPSFELFRMMPRKWQKELLEGVIGADLIGFHTMDYAEHFLDCVQKILGLDHTRNVIRCQDRLVKVDVFPISIDYQKFHHASLQPQVVDLKNKIAERMKGCRIIFSIDRLDYTKGVYSRLLAYELFLKKHPEYHQKVVFIITIIPSRDTIPKYAERKKMIDQTISRINSHIGNLHWQPVIYHYKSLHFDELVSLYSVCDIALITPLRDGMNLVAKEFVASRNDQQGVLILSEMAGASRELADALLINPNDMEEMASKIAEGLEMPAEEQNIRMRNMQKRIKNYDVQAWAADYMSGLASIKQKQQCYQEIFLDEFSKRHIYDCYRSSKRRLLLLDYDGTLIPYTATPDLAVPGPHLLHLLEGICSKEETDVYLMSGRSSNWLDQYFGYLPINLVSEHGARCRKKGEEWVTEIQKHSEWKESVHNILERYVRRCPHSFIEEKEFSIVWHYRNAQVDQGKLKSQELICELKDFAHQRNLEIISDKKAVEVRTVGINKGTTIAKILSRAQYDFVFAAGDDKTDEDMFKLLSGRENCFTIKVGPHASYARYNLLKPQMVLSVLEGLEHLTIASVHH